jgi:ribosomal protein L40E
MAKIAAAQVRMFKNVFICKECNSKIKAEPRKILLGKIKCRKCGATVFRPKRKK